jgi:RHS repeat-associated protein
MQLEKNASSVETSRKSWSYDPAGNWYATGDSTSTTHRTHDSMNRLNQIGGSGKTVVEGTLDEAANVSVSGQPAQIASVPGTTDYNFRKEIPVTEGNNNFQITATDAIGNARTQNYSVQVEPAQKTYEYDSNGNLLREKDPQGAVIRSFEWDGADRIKAINWGSQRVEWTYNGLGQKVLETVNGVASKRFLWDGAEMLLEKNAAYTITKKYYGDGEQRVGGTDAGNYFYTRDHLGSVREVVKQDGNIQARYDYDSYGKRSVLYQNAAYLGGCIFGYTGHITLPALVIGQSEILLTHYRAYDPHLGRWLSADPIGEAGGMNLYGYVGGDPMKWVDVLGLDISLFPKGSKDEADSMQAGVGPMRKEVFDVDSHGSQHGVVDERGAEMKILTPDELADEIILHKNYKKGMTIYLNSCHTGSGWKNNAGKDIKVGMMHFFHPKPDNFAQKLADAIFKKIGKETSVFAPNASHQIGLDDKNTRFHQVGDRVPGTNNKLTNIDQGGNGYYEHKSK